MTSFDLNSINSALDNSSRPVSGVDFSGKSLKLDTEKDAQPIVDAINACPDLQYLTLTGNTLGVPAAQAIAKVLQSHPELKICRWSDMFTGRMKTEIPPALSALGEGMITAGARLQVLDLSDNAFGPIGVEGLVALLKSDVCKELQELRLNNNGLGISGGRLLASALSVSARRLRVFVAGRNRLENDGAKALAAVFQNMGTLEEVSMPQNGIYHVGVTALSQSFTHNPKLRSLDLNDNTIGPKGAKAIADTIHSLKNLKCINFGDCLLKSKGAKALAKALKENDVKIESLDLSHNEIGREACMEIVTAVTSLPDSASRLSRVALAGNSLGGSANKRTMKDKLGPSAALSDGEGSDDEYVTDIDEQSSESEQESDQSDNEDSATEDAQHTVIATDISKEIVLDTSGIEEIESDVARFLQYPTIENLRALGPNAADVIDTHLRTLINRRTIQDYITKIELMKNNNSWPQFLEDQHKSIKDPTSLITAYVEATLMVSGLSDQSDANAISLALYPILIERAGQQHAASWILANAMLKGLGLIKSENKDYKIRWDTSHCFSVLSAVCVRPYFPAALRDTIKFFVGSKMAAMTARDKQALHQSPLTQ